MCHRDVLALIGLLAFASACARGDDFSDDERRGAAEDDDEPCGDCGTPYPQYCVGEGGGCHTTLESDADVLALAFDDGDRPPTFSAIRVVGPEVTSLEAILDGRIVTEELYLERTRIAGVLDLINLTPERRSVVLSATSNPELTALRWPLVAEVALTLVDNLEIVELSLPDVTESGWVEELRDNPLLCTIDVGTLSDAQSCDVLRAQCPGSLALFSGCAPP